MTRILTARERTRIARHIERLGSSDTETGVRAERWLVRYGERAVAALIAAAEEPVSATRFRAVWALGEIKDIRGFEAISKRIEDPDPDVRYDACLALGNLGHERAIPLLQDLLLNQPSGSVLRGVAVNALIRLGAEGLDILLEASCHKSPEVRATAIRGLNDFPTDRRVRMVLDDRLRDGDREVQVAAIESLGMIGDCSAKECLKVVYREDEALRDLAGYWLAQDGRG